MSTFSVFLVNFSLQKRIVLQKVQSLSHCDSVYLPALSKCTLTFPFTCIYLDIICVLQTLCHALFNIAIFILKTLYHALFTFSSSYYKEDNHNGCGHSNDNPCQDWSSSLEVVSSSSSPFSLFVRVIVPVCCSIDNSTLPSPLIL